MRKRNVLFVALLMICGMILGRGMQKGGAAQWEVDGGSWKVGDENGRGQSADSHWARLLSHDWYNDSDISATIEPRNAKGAGSVGIWLRYAGPSESYAVILDRRGKRVYLLENHLGESRELVSVNVGSLDAFSVRVHIVAHQNSLRATIQPTEPNGNAEARLAFDDIKVPEGRLGLGVQDSEFSYSDLEVSGQTQSSYETYSLHCNYRLHERLAQQPLMRYLDEVASSKMAGHTHSLTTAQDFEQYRTKTLLKLRRSIGLDPWPERNALNARIVGTVDRGDYTIDKVIFESHPHFFVDALLYLPKHTQFPVPGVLSAIGHYAEDDFYIWSEQARNIGLVEKGYVVLTYDPISQGERTWLGDGNHDSIRRKLVLGGLEATGLMVWDSIRAIDYLCSRQEVDCGKIGVTGVSGGGFNALYTTVLDPRVQVVAPDGYSTTIEALVKRGEAGCCAYLPNLDTYAEYQDIYALIAPRPVLMLGGYMDPLSDRILQIHDSASSIYELFGARDKLSYYLDPDAGHTYSKPMRLAMIRWFNKWLKGVDDPAQAREPKDPENVLIGRDSARLKVFPADEPHYGKDVIDLLRSDLRKYRVSYSVPTNTKEVTKLQENVRDSLVGLMGDVAPPEPPIAIQDDGVTGAGKVRHVLLKSERNLSVPLTIFYPRRQNRSHVLIVYLSMTDQHRPRNTAEQMARLLQEQGFTVALPRVRGSELEEWQKEHPDIELFSMALGKHLFSGRIYDLQQVIGYLATQRQYRGLQTAIWGEGIREGLMTLYLAAIDHRVQVAIASHSLVSYQNIVDEDGLPDFDWYVPGVLRYADLPQIIAAIAPRPVIISEAVDVNGKPVLDRVAETAYAWPEHIYQLLGRPEGLSVVSPSDLIPRLKQ